MEFGKQRAPSPASVGMKASTLKRIIEDVAGQVRALYAYVNIWTQLTPAQKEQADALNYNYHSQRG